jgi:hypothetical protein
MRRSSCGAPVRRPLARCQCNDISHDAAASAAMITMNRMVVPFPWIAALIVSHMPATTSRSGVPHGSPSCLL